MMILKWEGHQRRALGYPSVTNLIIVREIYNALPDAGSNPWGIVGDAFPTIVMTPCLEMHVLKCLDVRTLRAQFS